MANEWRERELEDYVVADIGRFLGSLRVGGDISAFEVGIIGRQVKCRYGVIDLLVYSTRIDTPMPFFTVSLLEFKSVQADKKTVEQVMRYMTAIEQIGIYDAVPDDDFFDYAHMVDSYIYFESMIVAPSFSEAIKWYPNRVLATYNGSGFDFAFDKGIKGTRRDNDELQTALMPIIKRATQSARQWHLTQRLQDGMNSTDIPTQSN